MDSNRFNSIENSCFSWIVEWINRFSEAFKLISDSLSIILQWTLKISWNLCCCEMVLCYRFMQLWEFCVCFAHTHRDTHTFILYVELYVHKPVNSMNKRHHNQNYWRSFWSAYSQSILNLIRLLAKFLTSLIKILCRCVYSTKTISNHIILSLIQ